MCEEFSGLLLKYVTNVRWFVHFAETQEEFLLTCLNSQACDYLLFHGIWSSEKNIHSVRQNRLGDI